MQSKGLDARFRKCIERESAPQASRIDASELFGTRNYLMHATQRIEGPKARPKPAQGNAPLALN